MCSLRRALSVVVRRHSPNRRWHCFLHEVSLRGFAPGPVGGAHSSQAWVLSRRAVALREGAASLAEPASALFPPRSFSSGLRPKPRRERALGPGGIQSRHPPPLSARNRVSIATRLSVTALRVGEGKGWGSPTAPSQDVFAPAVRSPRRYGATHGTGVSTASPTKFSFGASPQTPLRAHTRTSRDSNADAACCPIIRVSATTRPPGHPSPRRGGVGVGSREPSDGRPAGDSFSSIHDAVNRGAGRSPDENRGGETVLSPGRRQTPHHSDEA